MLDHEAIRQQEALSIIGINLIYAAFYSWEKPEELIGQLLDNLTWERIEVDMIRFAGPAFAETDNRLMALQLVEKDLTEAAMFTAEGEAVQWGEVLYKKPVLVQRGSFRPFTNAMLDMLQHAQEQFIQEEMLQGEAPTVIFEMTLRQLQVENAIDPRDFLDRVDMLSALGHPVLISNFLRYHRLLTYLWRYTQKPIGLPLGLVRLRDLMDEKFYTDLPGGIMESLGQLFRTGVKMYVYPSLERDGNVTTLQNMEVVPHLKHLQEHLVENGYLEDIHNFNRDYLSVYSGDVLKKIKSRDPLWEKQVPPPIAQVIKSKKLFGWQA
jgi:hypothetical protein